MKRYSWAKCVAMVSLIALPVLTSGCSVFKSNDQSKQIDPPSSNLKTSGSADADSKDKKQGEMQVTLYFKDQNGYVAPLSVGLPKTVSVAKKALEYMVKEGPSKDLLPEGFTALLPEDTKVNGLAITKDKLAIVDLSKQFADYDAKDERKIMEAITYTLTGFPSVDKVELRVDGRTLKEMPKDGTPLDEPLTRTMGINIERSDGVDLADATPVTIYFMNDSGDYQYYVPVTRIVQRTDDVATAALEQLIKGPQDQSKLQQVIAPTAKLLGVNKSNDVITVNFDGSLLDAEHKASEEALQSVILSLTENTGSSRVQIKIDGDVKVSSTEDKNYSKPVARPIHLNPIKL